MEVIADENAGSHLNEHVMLEAVADKGYHSNDVLTGVGQMVQ